MAYGTDKHIFNKVGWIRGPIQSVAFCTLCPSSRPFVASVTKADRKRKRNAMAAAQEARAKVAAHIREKHADVP